MVIYIPRVYTMVLAHSNWSDNDYWSCQRILTKLPRDLPKVLATAKLYKDMDIKVLGVQVNDLSMCDLF